MKNTILKNGILGFISVCVALGLLLIEPAATTAKTDSPPSPSEKQDSSRGKNGRSGYFFSATETSTLSTSSTDNYGYTISTAAPSWIDATTGTKIEFENRDDDYVHIPIGFEFPFYENVYSTLYVSTNGMLTFGESSDAFENRDIPRDTRPNNFIAPFWDDLLLLVNTSNTYYRNGTDSLGDYFVIEWEKISRLETQQDRLTFEVVLRKNGDILFQYDLLAGIVDQATVGIEDEQGVDGNLFLYNFAGLTTAQAVHFKYPTPSARVKIYPINHGGLISGGVTDLQFTIRNNGDLGPDTYDLNLSSYPPSWKVKFYNSNGSLLVDTNGNGKIDTGLLNQGAEMVVKIRVTAPVTAEIGEGINVNLSAVSSISPNKQAQATFDAAIPTAFAQALQRGIKMNLHLVWRENQISSLATTEQFLGSNLAVQRLANGNYLYSWERNGSTSSYVSFADLKFTILSDLGGTLVHEKSLTDHSNVSEQTQDRNLVSGITSSNTRRIGVLWVRMIDRDFGSEWKSNQNIWFAIINENGNIIEPAKNLTNNTNWLGDDDIGMPTFITPKIAVTDDDHFVLAWTKEVNKGNNNKVSDIEYTILDVNGSTVKPKALLTNSQAGGKFFITPTIEKIGAYRVLLSYSKISDPNSGISSLVYQVLDSNGTPIKAETSIGDSDGATVHDSVRLNANVLLAWPSPKTGTLGFALVSGATEDLISPTQHMASPNRRDISLVSVARDEIGRGIITWADRNQREYMYYALVSSDGTKITQEMIYLTSSGTTLSTNAYGYGLASYEGTWQNLLPLVAR